MYKYVRINKYRILETRTSSQIQSFISRIKQRFLLKIFIFRATLTTAIPAKKTIIITNAMREEKSDTETQHTKDFTYSTCKKKQR